jgi:transposase
MRIAIGMDLHKKSAVCFAVYAGEGQPAEDEMEFLERFNRDHRTQPSEPEDIAAIARALEGHEAHFLIENSTKTFDTYWVLTNLGCHVTVAQSRDLYRITKSVKKNDNNDSMELAFYMRRRLHGENEFSVCVMPSKEWMQLREICRTVFKEKAHLADLKRRARAHLLLHGIRLSREYENIFCKRAIAEMESTCDVCLRIFANEAKTILRRTDMETRTIELMFRDIRIYALILSIPGFGRVSAAYLASMIMDIARFDTCNQFTASFGIVPKQRESSDVSHNCATTHRGDEEARRLLKQAAWVHVNNCDSVVTRMYRRLKRNGKAHNEVLVACARKLLTVVWSVLRSDRPFTTDPRLLARSAAMAEEVEGED